MRLEFEIISDRVEPIFCGDPSARRHVRMLGLRDTDTSHPLRQPAEFILDDTDARRFASVFRHSSVGRLVILAVGDFHLMGFGRTLRLLGRIGHIR
ncbi:MAG: hypothetical protein IT580_14910 [Verrucomicrobiales bacterium]|nr:hypothetical protein [Verrucomicrobiales bacterium]